MPYWRLSGFYLFYFAALGALVPYWSLYLRDQGFGPDAIGELMAVLMATKIIAPNIWGWIADRRGRRIGIVRGGSLAAVVAFAGVFLGSGFWWLAVVMALFSFFWNAVLPQFEVITLSHLGDGVYRYARIRLWGSIGFILAVMLLGRLLDQWGTDLLPPAVLALYAGIWLTAVSVPEAGRVAQVTEHPPLRAVLRRPEVIGFFVVCFLMQASHGPYYTFYTLYLEDHGYSRAAIGQLWALGVVAEILLFLLMPRLLRRFGAYRVLLASLVLAALRWLVIGTQAEHALVMAAAQLLHAASFGTYHAAAIHLVHRYFVGRNQGRGQALYSSLSFGAGGALGSLASGYLWAGAGPAVTYGLAAGAAALAAGITAWTLRNGHATEA